LFVIATKRCTELVEVTPRRKKIFILKPTEIMKQ